jgi:hypothetical protein
MRFNAVANLGSKSYVTMVTGTLAEVDDGGVGGGVDDDAMTRGRAYENENDTDDDDDNDVDVDVGTNHVDTASRQATFTDDGTTMRSGPSAQ